MATCPTCCPNGGAIFRMDYVGDNYAMTCQNCGHQRKHRGANKTSVLHTYDFVTKEAASDKGMSRRNAILFHCFNPNGVYARLKQLHERVNAWCDAHPERPNGVILVHGSLNDFPRKQLFEALDAPRKRKNVSYTINAAIDWVERAIIEGDKWLDDPSRWPNPK